MLQEFTQVCSENTSTDEMVKSTAITSSSALSGITLSSREIQSVLTDDKVMFRIPCRANPATSLPKPPEGIRVGATVFVREPWQISEDGKLSYKIDELHLTRFGDWLRPSSMKTRHARIFLRINSISAERLHNISNRDLIREGMAGSQIPGPLRYRFRQTWNALHSDPFSWENNPFVYVVNFKRIKP